jgi:polysaccharide export outer membrane protein
VIDRVWRCGLVVVMLLTATRARADTSATIAAGDSVSVAVADEKRVTATYLVDEDGTITVPMIGRLQVSGLTAERLRTLLTDRLAAFLTNPSVQVAFTPPRRIFVLGNVARPGVVELTVDMTALEALLAVGYNGSAEVMIVRTGNARSPVLPAQAQPADVIHVNLRNFERDLASGDLSRNVRLEPGDTLYVPARDPNEVFVSGEVARPGAYSVPDGTTVLQVLTLAGGATKRAAARRTHIMRIHDGQPQDVTVDLNHQVLPGDTIVVPETFVNPTFSIGPADGGVAIPGMNSPQIALGESVSLTQAPEFANPVRLGHLTLLPVVPLTAIGVDQNVFNSTTDPKSDFVVALAPKIGAKLDAGRMRVSVIGGVGLQYYHTYESERSVNPSYGASIEYDIGSRTTVTAGGGYLSTRDRFNHELDARVRREEGAVVVGAEFGPWGRASVNVSAEVRNRTVPGDPTFAGSDLSQTLNGRSQKATVGFGMELTPSTAVSLTYAPSAFHFPQYPAKDATGGDLTLGSTFKAGALLEGGADLSLLQYVSTDATFAPYRGVGWSARLRHTWERSQIEVHGQRAIGTAFESNVAFSLVDEYGLSLHQQLPTRLDVALDADRIRYAHYGFDPAVGPPTPVTPEVPFERYTAELGVLIGRSRLALQTVYEDRGGPFSFSNLRWNIVYNLIQVRK